jgi:hypothetical protein
LNPFGACVTEGFSFLTYDITKNPKKPTEEYLAYLKSDRWQRKRSEALVRAKYRCEKCGAKCSVGIEQLHVHHKTYRRLGNERASDLMVVCRGCHDKIHKPHSKPQPDATPRTATSLFINPFAKEKEHRKTTRRQRKQAVKQRKADLKRKRKLSQKTGVAL